MNPAKSAVSRGKNGKIELFRFLFCLSVIFFHLEKYVLGEPPLTEEYHFGLFPHGAMGVEFFFLLSGLLMAKSAHRRLAQRPTVRDYTSFLKGKYLAVFPQHVVAFAFTVTAWCLFLHYDTVPRVLQYLLDSIPNFLLIHMTGFRLTVPNHVEWYISCMLIAMAILYPICRRYYYNFTRYYAPLSALLILGWIFHDSGALTGVSYWTGLSFKSVLRAISEISLGTTAYELSRFLSTRRLSNWKRTVLTIVEWLTLAAVMFYVISTCLREYEFYIPFGMFLLLSISFSGVTWGSKYFNNRFFNLLGSLTLPLYLSQIAAVQLTLFIWPYGTQDWQIGMGFLLTSGIAAVVFLVPKLCKTIAGQVRKRVDKSPA